MLEAQFEKSITATVTKIKTDIENQYKKLDLKMHQSFDDIAETYQKKINEKSLYDQSIEWYKNSKDTKTSDLNGKLQELSAMSLHLEQIPELKNNIEIVLLTENIQIKISSNLGMSMEDSSTFDDLVVLFTKTNSNAISLQKMRNAKMSYEQINNHISNYNNIFASAGLILTKNQIALLRELNNSKDGFDTIFHSEKANTLKILNNIKSSFSKLILSNANYIKYKNMIEETNDDISSINNSDFEIEKYSNFSKNIGEILDMFKQKIPRLIPEDEIILQERIDNIKSIIKLINFNDEDYRNISNSHDIDMLKAFKDRTIESQQDGLKIELARLEEQKIIMNNIFNQERELDKFLGILFASLQNNSLTDKKMQICFSHQEFPIFLYYMTLTGFIRSNKIFLTYYLSNLDNHLKAKSARQISLLFFNRETVNNQIISSSQNLLTEEVQTNLVNKYSDLMKMEMVVVFDKQLEYRRNPTFLKLILNHMGLEGTDILEQMLEVGYEMYFGKLAEAIIAVVGISIGFGILTSIVTIFISWLCAKVVSILIQIAKDNDQFQEYKNSFLFHMKIVYRKLFQSEIYSFDHFKTLKTQDLISHDSLTQSLRFDNGCVNKHAFMILDSIFSGYDLYIDSEITNGQKLYI